MEDAFDLLVDASAVGDALPGARPASLGATDGTLVVEGLLDGEAVTLRGRVAPLERDRAAGALSFHATADDGSGGRAIAAGAVRLRDAGGLTAVAIQLDLETAGRLQAVTTEAIEAAVHRLVDGLAAGLRARAGGSQPPGDEPDGEDAGAVTSGGTAEAVGSPVRGEATGVAVPVPDLLEAASEHWETIGYAWMTDAMGPAVTGHRPAAAPPFAALGELPPP
ncbi:MAG TPA: hypothetical protein VFO60_11810, partial [Candidatus Dormibacteraeota bacterium]|nr:hypothetical protein [Candidatus Dormibacteraeota bacterium]